MKIKTCTILISILLIVSASVVHGKKEIRRLKPGERAIEVDEVLTKLSNPDWKERFRFLSKFQMMFRRNEYLKASPEIKNKLVKLLEKEHQFRKTYFLKLIKSGKTDKEATEQFSRDYMKSGFTGYVLGLTHLVTEYFDVETVPLILMTDANYASGEITLQTYMLFGKEAFDKIIKMSKEGTQNTKVTSYLRLAGWVNKTLNDKKMDAELKLNREEIVITKERLIDGLDTASYNEKLYINHGLYLIFPDENNENEKKRIKDILKISLKNKSGSIRKDVVRFLGEIGDVYDIEAIEKLLKDSYCDAFTNHKRQIKATGKTDIQPVYPVREAAREAIEKIKARHGMNKKNSNLNESK